MSSAGRKKPKTKAAKKARQRQLSQEGAKRGHQQEMRVYRLARDLLNNLRLPIYVEHVPNHSAEDRQGVDIKFKGCYYSKFDDVMFGLDIKSSFRGVEQYTLAQNRLKAQGQSPPPYPRYAFVCQRGETDANITVRILKYILTESRYSKHVVQIPFYGEEDEPLRYVYQELSTLMEKIVK